MKHVRLEEMVRGWFIGRFAPSVYDTSACEVALKNYTRGDCEGAHFHKVATEITLVVSGRIRMAGNEWQAGDIIVLEPGEVSAFEALTDSVNVVVKIPGVIDDKYTSI